MTSKIGCAAAICTVLTVKGAQQTPVPKYAEEAETFVRPLKADDERCSFRLYIGGVLMQGDGLCFR